MAKNLIECTLTNTFSELPPYVAFVAFGELLFR